MEPAPVYRYYASQEEFRAFHHSLKHRPCPHCGLRGCLILHGYLVGYGDGSDPCRRGHRVFCSNRHRRAGCGRTFSLLKSWVLRRFMITARVLTAFLAHLCKGICQTRAWKTACPQISRSCARRLYQSFTDRQPGIRTLLNRIKAPPVLPGITDPVIQTIRHLKAAFKGCFVARFQRFFQVSLL